MNIYNEIFDATQVSHALLGHFTSEKTEQLIVAKTNILSVYTTEDGKLVLLHEFKLHGQITGMALVPQMEGPLDCLVVSTGKAKLSLVRFDPSMPMCLETLSLHYYEAEFTRKNLIELAKTSKLRLDPERRCVLLFNSDVLALLPLNINEEDEDDNQEPTHQAKKRKVENGDARRLAKQSSVLHVSDLSAELKNVVDIQFLNSFSQPTLAVLYQPRLAWSGNDKVAGKGSMRLMAITPHEKKNTTIYQVKELPHDVHTIIPLANSCVLVGVNEIVSVDNTGAIQSTIQLNSFSPKFTGSKQIDNSSLEVMFTEPIVWASAMVSKDREILILMDHKADMYSITLQSEGRLLIDFTLVRLPIVNDIFKDQNLPTCIVALSGGIRLKTCQFFIGFSSGDAVVVKSNNLRSAFESQYREAIELPNDEDEDYDALYGDDEDLARPVNDNKATVETAVPFEIELMDSLINVGPITSICTGRVSSINATIEGLPNPNRNELAIVSTSGHDSGTYLNVMEPSVRPLVQQALKFTSVTKIWNLKIRKKDKYLVTTDSGAEKSDVYEIGAKIASIKPKHFKRNVTTVEIAILGGGKRIVQVTTKAVYLFNLGFKKLMTISFDFEVVHVSILDPFILLTNSKGEIKIYELDSKHRKKLTKVPLPEVLEEMIITSGAILKSSICNQFMIGLENADKDQLLFTFVGADNQIIMFPKEHHDRVFQLNGVDMLSEMLYVSTYQLPEEIVPDPSIKQVMINKLGKDKKEEFLTILTFGGEIYMYRKTGNKFFKSMQSNDLQITGAPGNAYAKGVSAIERIAHYVKYYNGYSIILITGSTPYMIVKEDYSTPKIFKFANIPLVSLAPWGTDSVLCVDDIKNARIVTLDTTFSYGNRLPVKRVPIEDPLNYYGCLNNVAYHERSGMYIVSYTKEIEYEAISEEGEKTVGSDDSVPHARGFQSGVLLLNPKSWNIIDKADYEKNSLINDMKTMLIQTNSRTRRKREYLVVGNTFVRDEDIGTMGSFCLYDITEVVPEPGKPDTNYKLKQIFYEEFRGAVSSVCEISGRFLISQSQKVLVRDVQEDNSVVPVAFLDVPVFVTDSKSCGNLLIIGDAMQGFQFVGFDAEPYRMIPLGKSVSKFEVMSLEFLVNNGSIYFLVSDRSNILHILKYAPDEPNSLSGQKLVHCTSFNLHSTNTCMKLLLKNDEFPTLGEPPAFQAIGAQTDGSLFNVVPLSESSYRRLYMVQQQLIEKDVHLCGLNPKMERLQNDFYQLGHLMRPMLDFTVIKSFATLPLNKRKQIAAKAGRQADFEIWRDLINVEYSTRSLC
ncbi:cleavage/polyadenylation factor CFT1 [Lachancea thermotolerans CBS 6340]|uniref:KLTH0G05984p n=1 Tax=Lachancea thermotolerans (strain ATCC 56472 / CBS 6340 / NRRL Y-8284) TaxID=559295 RepID=C5DM49_LACTC|nr:KLTH0G05984p [Lachancea thermotolerans CBS 6340]CAR24860.1 KLTH0G05984p [Lachancea thermotolerans CBS 6340]